MKIKVSTPGWRDLIKTKEELETTLRKGMEDNRVDLILLNLDTKGKTTFSHRDTTITLEVVEA